MSRFPRPGRTPRPRPVPTPGPTTSPTPGPGTTFTLTTGSDTATANVFEGPVQIVGNFALNTLTNGDRLTGVGENPTLRVDINTGVTAANITPAALNNLNTLEVNFTALGGAGVASTLNIGNGTGGFRNVVWANSNAANTLSGINTALSNLAISNVAVGNQTFNFGNNALSGTADVLNLSLQNVNPLVSSAVGSINLNSAAGLSNYETVNVVSSGNGNVVNIAQIGNGLSTLNVTGSAPFTTVNASTNLTTFNAGTATGAITYTAVTGEGNASYTGGSANDAIFLAGTYTSNDTVNGGGGTADILGLNSEQLVAASSAAQTNVTNIETLAVQDAALASATYTTSRFASVNQLQLNLGASIVSSANLTVNNAAGAFTITSLGDLGTTSQTLTVNAAGTGTNDSLVLALNDLATSAPILGTGAIQLNGYESATINAIDPDGIIISSGITLAPNIGGSSSLSFTGAAGSLQVQGAITSSVVNASGLTVAGLNNTNGSGVIQTNGAAGANITGSNQADSLGGSTSADIINSGLGNDVVNGIDGGDVITLGAGADTLQITNDGTTGALNAQATSVTVVDFVTGSTATTSDQFDFGVTALNTVLSATLSAAGGTAVSASTDSNVQSFLSNVASTAPTGTNIIKITGGTNTVATNSANAGFAAAIGAGSIATGFTGGEAILVTYYDSANAQAVLGSVAPGSSLTAGDTFTILGRATISATDFANLGNIQFDFI